MYVKTRTRYALVSADFSQQEPHLLAQITQDEKLLETYEQGKDLYGSIGASIYHKDYWDCMEHYEDGTPNPDGEKLRKKVKQMTLGMMYGMGANLMSERMGVSVQECREILKNFFDSYPRVKEFVDNNKKIAKEVGFVEDYIGRRRHLPDASLPEIEVDAKKTVYTDYSVFPKAKPEDSKLIKKDEETSAVWQERYDSVYAKKGWGGRDAFKREAKDGGINFIDNGSRISKTLTQCTNARIQGSAATMTKKAMVAIFNDEKLKDLGFRLLIPIHDELMGEAPVENAVEAGERLEEVMIKSALPECTVRITADSVVSHYWYADEVMHLIQKEYNQLLKDGLNEDGALSNLYTRYSELSEGVVKEMATGEYDLLRGGV